jgi:recombination protein RecA
VLPATDTEHTAAWGLAPLRGRLVELSARGATATLTTAIELVGEAQREGEPVAWIMGPRGSFYPPDVADSGIDLAALVVVRVPDLAVAARAAERLTRSGAFGLVVIDLADDNVELPIAHQGRLVTLAQAHDAAIVCITEKPSDAASLGSLISLRAEALRMRTPTGFELKLRVLKDKRRGPGFTAVKRAKGPAGL